jgi:uncharacterized membrane protein
MNTTRLHPIAEEYLNRLDAAAGVLPDRDREDLVNELRGHLATGLRDGAPDAEVLNMLDDLGSPAEIVAAAREAESGSQLPRTPEGTGTPGASASPWGTLEVLAVLGLTLGTFVVPVVGPLAGLIFAWASPRWNRTEKIVATLLAILPVVALGLGAIAFMASGPSSPVPVSPTPQHILGIL